MGIVLIFYIFIYRITIPIVLTIMTATDFFDKRCTADPAKHPVFGEKTFLFLIFMTIWSWLQASIMKDELQDDRIRARNIIRMIYFLGIIALIIIWKKGLYIY